jgi:hypothetical protein
VVVNQIGVAREICEHLVHGNGWSSGSRGGRFWSGRQRDGCRVMAGLARAQPPRCAQNRGYS